jgi:WhiB family redox-sensing transcriptional regulator
MASSDTAWRAKGACQGLDAEIFYPESEELADVAKAICGECNVRLACLSHALDNREQQGVWGGATAKERRRLLRQRRHTA